MSMYNNKSKIFSILMCIYLLLLTSCSNNKLDVNDPHDYCWQLFNSNQVVMYIYGSGAYVHYIIDDYRHAENVSLTAQKTNVKSESECSYLNSQH